MFAGDWTWASGVPPQLGIETCGFVSRVGGGEELLGAEQCAHALRHQALGGVDDGTFGTEAAHGESVADMVPPSSPVNGKDDMLDSTLLSRLWSLRRTLTSWWSMMFFLVVAS